MSIKAGVGYSQLSDTDLAIAGAYAAVKSSLGNVEPDQIIVFSSPTKYNPQKLLDSLNNITKAKIIGCSTAGEITSAGGSLDMSIALMGIASQNMYFVDGIGHDIKKNARQAGVQLAENLNAQAKGKLKSIIMLPDGIAGNGADIVRGVLDVMGESFPVVGGSAGDYFLFRQTYQYLDKEVYSGSVVGLGICGDFNYSIGVRHGWIPIGIPRKVTKSSGNILYELDNKPAIEIYDDQFGKEKQLVDKKEPFARLAITYPLGIASPGKDGYLIRDPMTVDDAGAITCAAEIAEGTEVSIMIGSRDEAIAAARDAARNAVDKLSGKKPKAALLFNCIARKKLLLSRKHEEIEAVRKILGEDLPVIGFYTYGEQAPLGGQVLTCSFHNETDVIFLLSD